MGKVPSFVNYLLGGVAHGEELYGFIILGDNAVEVLQVSANG
jgi:hypothetical protein